MGYKGPNEISEDVIERKNNFLSVVEVLDPEDETVTRGSLYTLPMLNGPETSHLGKTLTCPNW